MKVIKDTIQTEIGRWSDPGDYPSGAGSYPLPSYEYVEDVSGEIHAELSADEVLELKTAIEDGCLQEWIEQLDLDKPDGVDTITWHVELKEQTAILTVKEFEPDTDWSPEPSFSEWD